MNYLALAKRLNTILDLHQEDAQRYLERMANLRGRYGDALPIVHGWFFSTNSKWTIVEPRIFHLYNRLGGFDLNVVRNARFSEIAEVLKPVGFYNELSQQLQAFGLAVIRNFSDWHVFVKFLETGGIYPAYAKLKRERARVTFKNLAGMMVNLGLGRNLVIPDKHVARVIKISGSDLKACRTDPALFGSFLQQAHTITRILETTRGKRVAPVLWSLAVWFFGSRTRFEELVQNETILT